MKGDYQAGVCNIGPNEALRRKRVGYMGLALTISTIVMMSIGTVSRPTRFLVVVPAMIAATGFIQARKQFCLAFGLAGTFNFGKLGEFSKVETAEFRAADRAMVIRMFLQASAIALTVGIIFFALPL